MTNRLDPNAGTDPPIDLQNPAGYTKLLVYIGITFLGTIRPLIQDNVLGFSDIVQVLIAVLGLFLVYQIKQAKWAKAWATLGLAGLQALALVVTDATNLGDVTLDNWIAVILAVGAAGGVAFIPNKKAFTLAA